MKNYYYYIYVRVKDINADLKKKKKENCLFLLHLRIKIVLTELYIILVHEKCYLFYLFDYPWIKKVVLYDCTFEICFVYERKCGDMMFCNLNF